MSKNPNGQKSIFAIIPAKNEAGRIADVINKTKKYVGNILVVDDGSSDNTFKEAVKANVYALRHAVNLGKGCALKTGCEFAIRKKAGVIIFLDADGQHDPAEIPKFIKALKDNDIVFGYRQLNENMPPILKFGNWFINSAISLLYKINLRDTQSGFRAFKSAAYKKILWNANDYYVESEIIAKTGKNKLKYKEIPIKTIYNDRYKGTTVLDGFKIVARLIWGRMRLN